MIIGLETLYIISVVVFFFLASAIAVAWLERLRNKNLVEFFTKKLEAKQLVNDAQDKIIEIKEQHIIELLVNEGNQRQCLEELKTYIANTNLSKAERTNILLAINAVLIKGKE